MLGFVCNSRTIFRGIIKSVTGHNTYSRRFETLSRSASGSKRLTTQLKLLISPSYLALNDFLEFQLEGYLFAMLTEIVSR